ncbi:MAG: metalloregulator ArsR/SmtB family transcription factor [Streptosporangiales bacterium]|nr:metalloregulator ArsR/SmtB family transcription factor [Streptosporangiales bacterium]
MDPATAYAPSAANTRMPAVSRFSGASALPKPGRVRDDPPRADSDKFYAATVRLDADGTVLVPSVHVNPHFVIKHYPGHPVAIQYAMTNEAAGRPYDAGLTLDEVRRRLSVLHDPLRLELCHSILRNAMTTTELATRFQMTVPQMSRHLRHLREAGLVHTHRDGAQVHYQLDQEAFRRLGTDLLTALHR